MSLDMFLKKYAPLTERERELVIESWNTAYHEIVVAQQIVQLTLLTEPVNYCVPINGVHAPFCTGHKSQSG